jgi:hypothetical protein
VIVTVPLTNKGVTKSLISDEHTSKVVAVGPQHTLGSAGHSAGSRGTRCATLPAREGPAPRQRA